MTANNVIRAWPAERLAELVELVKTKSIGAAARAMGVTKNMASGALWRAGKRPRYAPPPPKWPPARLAQLEQLAAGGASIAAAAREMHVTPSAAVGALRRAAKRAAKRPPAEPWQPPEPKGCRWIDGDPSKPGWSWCDAQTVRRGTPWCAEHHKRVWAPAR